MTLAPPACTSGRLPPRSRNQGPGYLSRRGIGSRGFGKAILRYRGLRLHLRESTREHSTMARGRARASTSGPMASITRASGKMARNMAQATGSPRKMRLIWASGGMGKSLAMGFIL